MPYEDRERAAKFYNAAFSWQMQMLGEEMGNYILATTTETENDRPTTPGAINGRLFPKDPNRPEQFPSLVIAVDEIKDTMQKVTAAGGEVLGLSTREAVTEWPSTVSRIFMAEASE